MIEVVPVLDYTRRAGGPEVANDLGQRHITQDGEQLFAPLADHFSDRKTDRRSDDGIPERADLAVHFWSKRVQKRHFG